MRPFMGEWRNELRDSELDGTAKLVGYTIATYMNAAGGGYPSKLTIAEGASCSERTVDRAVDRLEVAGFLEVSRSRGRSSNRYTATSPTPSRVSVLSEANPVTDDSQPRHSRRPTPSPVSGECAESAECVTTVKNAPPNGARSSTVCEQCEVGGNLHADWCSLAVPA